MKPEEGKEIPIYLLEDDSKPSNIRSTPHEKIKNFVSHLKNDKKINMSDVKLLSSAYEQGIHADQIPSKLQRKYADASEYSESCCKKVYVDPKVDFFPMISDPSYRLYISGLSGSGKSYFISLFLKHNPLKIKGAGIFLFSPVYDDKSLSTIKNLTHIDLLEVEAELKEELQLHHIPPGSVLIFDDVESYPKKVRKLYTDFRDVCLERGRHDDISTITVSHNCMSGNSTKVSIRESQYWVLFRSNIRDCKNILKIYGGLETKKINELVEIKSRWMFFKKTMPQYVVTEHSVMVL